MDYLDVTPTNESLYREARGQNETDAGGVWPTVRSAGGTPFLEHGRQLPVFQQQVDATATTEEVRASPVGLHRQWAVSHPSSRDPRDVRLALLARKYEGKASIEDTARLQILTERLRRLAPRVTEEDVQRAAEMVADAEGIAARLATMKARLGLR